VRNSVHALALFVVVSCTANAGAPIATAAPPKHCGSLMVSLYSGEKYVWNTKTGKRSLLQWPIDENMIGNSLVAPESRSTFAVLVSPDKDFLLSPQGTIKSTTKEIVRVFPGQLGVVNGVSDYYEPILWIDDSHILLWFSRNASYQIWDLDANQISAKNDSIELAMSRTEVQFNQTSLLLTTNLDLSQYLLFDWKNNLVFPVFNSGFVRSSIVVVAQKIFATSFDNQRSSLLLRDAAGESVIADLGFGVYDRLTASLSASKMLASSGKKNVLIDLGSKSVRRLPNSPFSKKVFKGFVQSALIEATASSVAFLGEDLQWRTLSFPKPKNDEFHYLIRSVSEFGAVCKSSGILD
jgi:hypothetical protein